MTRLLLNERIEFHTVLSYNVCLLSFFLSFFFVSIWGLCNLLGILFPKHLEFFCEYVDLAILEKFPEAISVLSQGGKTKLQSLL